jgi:hypothetical protein
MEGQADDQAAPAAWLKLSKADPDWSPATHFAQAGTTPEVWKMLTKDDAFYPGLRFSAKADKVQKYLAVAKFLHEHRAAGGWLSRAAVREQSRCGRESPARCMKLRP